MTSRVLLFTGKGGVGKTTTAAATALRCADDGLRTIVLSTDPAHSLADAFDVELGPLPVEVVRAALGRVGRGLRSVAWTPPRKGGDFTLRVEAIDLAGNPATIEGPLEVRKRPRSAR